MSDSSPSQKDERPLDNCSSHSSCSTNRCCTSFPNDFSDTVPEGEPADFEGEGNRPSKLSGNEAASITSATESGVAANRRLSRILTGSFQEAERVAVDYSNCPKMGGERPFPPALPSSGLYEVTFDGPNDPIHPFNRPIRTKLILCVVLGYPTVSRSLWHHRSLPLV